MNDDLLLVKRLQEGDEKAFAQIVDRYSNMVLRLAYGFVQDYQEAED